MRANIEIDDELVAEAMRLSGQRSKRAVVEEALILLVRVKRQKDVFQLFGKIEWEGDLDQSRLGRGLVVLPVAEFESMQETMHPVSTPANAQRLRASISQADAGTLETHEIED